MKKSLLILFAALSLTAVAGAQIDSQQEAEIPYNTEFCPPSPTPEPATLILMGVGVAGIATKVYRDRKKTKS